METDNKDVTLADVIATTNLDDPQSVAGLKACIAMDDFCNRLDAGTATPFDEAVAFALTDRFLGKSDANQ